MSEKICNICNVNKTSSHIHVSHDCTIYACDECMIKAQTHFVFYCMNCARSFFRNKDEVWKYTDDPDLKRGYLMHMDVQLVIGMDTCLSCDASNVINQAFTFSNRGGNC